MQPVWWSLLHWHLCDLLQEKDFQDVTQKAASKKWEQREYGGQQALTTGVT